MKVSESDSFLRSPCSLIYNIIIKITVYGYKIHGSPGFMSPVPAAEAHQSRGSPPGPREVYP